MAPGNGSVNEINRVGSPASSPNPEMLNPLQLLDLWRGHQRAAQGGHKSAMVRKGWSVYSTLHGRARLLTDEEIAVITSPEIPINAAQLREYLLGV